MKKRKLLALILIVALLLQAFVMLSACKPQVPPSPPDDDNTDDDKGEKMPAFNVKTYDNIDFSNYEDGHEKECDNPPVQWDQNGLGDPFVMRFNGMYYLYVSTKGGVEGVRGWKSTDMLHWEQCQAEGLQKGFVAEDPPLIHAYAPEVWHFNGKFYMVTSPDDNGHYTYVADNPEGPFTRITDNYHMVIDGTIFIDDDESFYFLSARHDGLQIHTMSSLDAAPDGKEILLKNTTIQQPSRTWTEGPMIIKRNGVYFLTYTGPEVQSPSYRVLYNTELDGANLAGENAFGGKAETPLLISTEDGFSGLGHSSTVLGPDMDSYYLVYHNLHEVTPTGACWRGLNIDRLLFNGTQMSIDGSHTDSIAPTMPTVTNLTVNGDNKVALSSTSTGKMFTAEFNFTGDKVKTTVSYADENNYAYVAVDYSAHAITLNQVKGGVTNRIAQGTLKNDFDPTVIHAVRVSYADGVADVYFDNMRKIADAEVTLDAGKIGYDCTDVDDITSCSVYYTAFSNVARGSSDQVELKQSGATIGANTYLPEGAYDKLTSYKFGEGSGLSAFKRVKETDAALNGAYQLKLANKDDFARYLTYFRESGDFALSLTYNAKYAGKRIGIQVDLGDVKTVRLPDIDTRSADLWTANIANLNIPKGARLITFYAVDTVEFVSFTFSPVTLKADISEDLLAKAVDADYYTNYNVTANGHATSNTRQAALFGDRYTDCEISVEINLASVNGKNNVGVILRADNMSVFSRNGKEDDMTCARGYYVGLSQSAITLQRYDFNYSQELLSYTSTQPSNTWITLSVTVERNTVTVSIDGMIVLEQTDARAITSGYFGIYSSGGSATYRNLTIKSI